MLLDTLPATVNIVSVWSEGPASQFKNRYVSAAVKVLEKKHNIHIHWNYFATSHGKGPDNDADNASEVSSTAIATPKVGSTTSTAVDDSTQVVNDTSVQSSNMQGSIGIGD